MVAKAKGLGQLGGDVLSTEKPLFLIVNVSLTRCRRRFGASLTLSLFAAWRIWGLGATAATRPQIRGNAQRPRGEFGRMFSRSGPSTETLAVDDREASDFASATAH